jgi:hypothetical protein
MFCMQVHVFFSIYKLENKPYLYLPIIFIQAGRTLFSRNVHFACSCGLMRENPACHCVLKRQFRTTHSGRLCLKSPDFCVLVRARAHSFQTPKSCEFRGPKTTCDDVYFETCVLVLYLVSSFFRARAGACSLQKPTFSHQSTDPCVLVRAVFVFASLFNIQKNGLFRKSRRKCEKLNFPN